ncbi:DUF6884 domain-containing protein [Flavonifractor sp. HCP28S3_F3]|uniref:DUF6884 domain-containing protein n=1 Tax=Flavonifractor sp. HCP28S3_F3 TaxID=3438939 RepID=UPI003F89DF6D
MKIALISCSKLKTDRPCPARELYAPSRLFSLSYQYARRNADKVYILSAKYGLVEESDVIAPYDLTLADLPEHRQRDWVNYVLTQMGERFDLERDTFLILAGRRYYQHLLPRLPHAILPLGNLPIGERIAFLQQQLADSAPCDNAASRCLRLHQHLTALPRYTWEEIDEVPFRNGIYLVFEEGETYREMPRIVRVGTHTSTDRLRQRLKDHFVRENHNGSIFRKNIGKALLNQTGDPYLPTWSLDTSRFPYKGMEDPHREREVEQAVSRYLRTHMTFSAFEVETQEQRLRLEEGIIASLHQTEDFQASSAWLGRFSPEKEIRESGMWLKQGLDGIPLDDEELEALECKVPGTTRTKPATVPAPTLSRANQAAQAGQKVGTAEIVRYILRTLAQHQAEGETSCMLISGEIHKTMGLKNKMPSVCNAMYQAMDPGDVVVQTTPSGKSSTIQICYQLAGRSF